MGIMDHFPKGLNPRKGQTEVLTEIEETWRKWDVCVIVAPTASGKSSIAKTIASYLNEQTGKGTSIITPTNQLVEQYLEDYPEMKRVKRKSQYATEAEWKRDKILCTEDGNTAVNNYHTYMANKLFNHILIGDEAQMLTEVFIPQVVLWQHILNYPDSGIDRASDLIRWAEDEIKFGDLNPTTSKLLKKTVSMLSKHPDKFSIEWATGDYKGVDRPCLKIRDLSPRGNPPFLWPPSKVRKIILMSATFNEHDLYDLRLDEKRVKIINIPSPIPVYRRKVIPAAVTNLASSRGEDPIKRLARWLRKKSLYHISEKGMAHVTYGMANSLRKYLGTDSRFIFHTQWDKDAKFREWLECPPESGKVLIACGMSTGISMDYDKARWQVIGNIPFPNVGDRAVQALLRARPEAYYWKAIRHVLQACGRTTRRTDDFSVTYIADSRFEKLYADHEHLFPGWFKPAIDWR